MQTTIIIAVAALILLICSVFKKPIKLVFKLLINTGLGFAALIIINMLGADFGIALGVNWTNAAIVGVLGVPGVALLLILKWYLLV